MYLQPSGNLPFLGAPSHVDRDVQIITGQIHSLAVNSGPGPLYCWDWISCCFAYQCNILTNPVLSILRSRHNHRSFELKILNIKFYYKLTFFSCSNSFVSCNFCFVFHFLCVHTTYLHPKTRIYPPALHGPLFCTVILDPIFTAVAVS